MTVIKPFLFSHHACVAARAAAALQDVTKRSGRMAGSHKLEVA